jgi:hypothetical protein
MKKWQPTIRMCNKTSTTFATANIVRTDKLTNDRRLELKTNDTI